MDACGDGNAFPGSGSKFPCPGKRSGPTLFRPPPTSRTAARCGLRHRARQRRGAQRLEVAARKRGRLALSEERSDEFASRLETRAPQGTRRSRALSYAAHRAAARGRSAATSVTGRWEVRMTSQQLKSRVATDGPWARSAQGVRLSLSVRHPLPTPIARSQDGCVPMMCVPCPTASRSAASSSEAVSRLTLWQPTPPGILRPPTTFRTGGC